MISSTPRAAHRREQRIEARRRQLIDAAATVFSQKGYENATTRDIAEEADVSEGTLYNYFENKFDLLVGVADAFADDLVMAIADIRPNHLQADLATFFADRFASGRERRLLMLFLYLAKLNDTGPRIRQAVGRIVQRSAEQIRVASENGEIRAVNPSVAAATISAAIMGFAVLYELGQAAESDSADISAEPFAPAQLGADITDIFLNGLGIPSTDTDIPSSKESLHD